MLKQFLKSEASGGLLLMAVAALALVIANSAIAPAYFSALAQYVGPLSVLHWINDALMAFFFLLVGLEIKREMLEGELSNWKLRTLPGFAALGGMIGPALIYLSLNGTSPELTRGWAIPTATDIAFALGVLSLLGSRVPVSLKVFLTALAIIDDLGAVLIIALFYTASLSLPYVAAAVFAIVALAALNHFRIYSLTPYMVVGAILWFCVLQSGVHATLAGVILAATIPLHGDHASPLHRLEKFLHVPVAFVVVPVFGFANAGVSLSGISMQIFHDKMIVGIALGLIAGKLIGVFGTVLALSKLKIAALPAGASQTQIFGVALLCGIGFTMSLFIALLAFAEPALQDRAKIGILMGSLLSGLLGYAVLRFAALERAT